MRKALALLAALALLGACSKEKDVEPPAELVDFTARLSVGEAWSVGMGGGEGQACRDKKQGGREGPHGASFPGGQITSCAWCGLWAAESILTARDTPLWN